ncbi:UvrABC system protein C [Nymphon striatum]|nr:UvrABC system protein C [Nymphon striatum]
MVITWVIKTSFLNCLLFIREESGDKEESKKPEENILSSFLSQYYISREIPAEILLSHKPEDNEPLEEMLSLKAEKKVSLAYKLRGDRQRWVEMAIRNAQHALSTHLASKAGVQKRVLALQEELNLDYIPARMECFDISHMMGEATVASCVVFGLEGAIKSEYRRYNISGIVGGDDYAAMRQALERRYKKAIEKESKLPDILFIDGGKGQVTQAVEVLNELQISGVDIIGVTKGEGRRQDMDTLTVLSQEDDISSVKEKIMLPAHSSALHLIQQVRDEAHRFAISGHRQRRKKTRNTSPLEGIEGLGPKRRQGFIEEVWWYSRNHQSKSSTIFGLAGLTDFIDGYLARKYNQESRFGAFLDPVADKLLVAVALLLIVEREGTLWITMAAVIIISREINDLSA